LKKYKVIIEQYEGIAKNILLNKVCDNCFFNSGENNCSFTVPWNHILKKQSKNKTCSFWGAK